MIEIGSWIGLAALTKSDITIKNVGWDYLGQIPNVFRKLGLSIEKKVTIFTYHRMKKVMKFRISLMVQF